MSWLGEITLGQFSNIISALGLFLLVLVIAVMLFIFFAGDKQ